MNDRQNKSRTRLVSMLKYIAAFGIFVVSPATAQVPLTPANIGAPARMIQIQFNIRPPQLTVQQVETLAAGTGQKPAGPCAPVQSQPIHSFVGIGFGGAFGGGMSMQALLNSMASLGQKPGGPCNPQPSSGNPQKSAPILSGIAASRPGQPGTPKIPGATNPKPPAVKSSGGSGGIVARPPLRVPTAPRVNQAATGGSGGGINMPRGGNSAMDALERVNTGAGLSSAAGSGSGGVSDRPRLGAQLPTAGVPTRLVVPPAAQAKAPPPSGGHGGITMTNSQSGNAPIKPSSQQSGSRFTPTTKLKVKPSIDRNIDYGGCGGCGSPKDPLVVR